MKMIAKAGQPFFWQLFEYVAGHRLDSLSCGDGLAVLQGGLDSPVGKKLQFSGGAIASS